MDARERARKAYVKFMMGHSSGTDIIKKQDMPGGVYDNAPESISTSWKGSTRN